jgi:hypothetical protein
MESEMPIIMYGYEFIIPSSFHTFVNSMYDINDLLEKPFQIRCILPTVYHDSLQHPMNYRIAKLVIGFVPDDQLAQLTANRNHLHEFLTDNPMLDGIEWMPHAKFYTGLEWYPDSESEEEEEEEEEDEEEDEEKDEEKDEEDDETLSHYISKYYL